MQKLIFSLGLITAGLVAGYLWQQWASAKGSGRVASIPLIRKRLQKVGLLFFMPISFVGAVWVVSFEDIRVVFLPFIGAGALLLGGFGGLGVAALMGKKDRQKGTLFCCGSFTNIGSIGALVSFVFLGESGFALVALYKMFEEIIYYSIGFPIARYFSGAAGESTFGQRIQQIGQDPFFLAATGSFICGFVLNQSGISRPPFFETINAFFVPAGTFTLLVSIGLGMRFASVTDHFKEGVAIAVLKFIAIPLVVFSAAHALGYQEINNGLPLKVALIVSSMPVAFTALVAASIYDLDLDLANACWLMTTAALVIVLPWLSFLLNLI